MIRFYLSRMESGQLHDRTKFMARPLWLLGAPFPRSSWVVRGVGDTTDICVGWADVTDAQHALLVADAGVVALDLDGGRFSDLPLNQRQRLASQLGIVQAGSDSLRVLVRSVVRELCNGIDVRRIGDEVI